MPITIGNGYLKSEIFINAPSKTREPWWKALWEALKDFFFSTGRAKADSYIHEMFFSDPPPTRERLADIFFELKGLACPSHKERFQVYNPHEDDSTIIYHILDENGKDELLCIIQNTDTVHCKAMGNSYFAVREQPVCLKSYPQMTYTINKKYSEIVECSFPSTLCLKLAGTPFLLVPLNNIVKYLYSELDNRNLDKWKTQEKANYLAEKIRAGIEKAMRILYHADISESMQQRAFLETMSMCGLKSTETSPPPTHIPIGKMVHAVLLEDKKFKRFLATDTNASQSMLAEIIEIVSDGVFRALFRTDPQAIQKMAEEQLTTLHVRSDQQDGRLGDFL